MRVSTLNCQQHPNYLLVIPTHACFLASNPRCSCLLRVVSHQDLTLNSVVNQQRLRLRNEELEYPNTPQKFDVHHSIETLDPQLRLYSLIQQTVQWYNKQFYRPHTLVMDIGDVSEEPTQPTRFIKHVEAINDRYSPIPPPQRKEVKNSDLTKNYQQYQAEASNNSPRRVETEASLTLKDRAIRNGIVSAKKLKQSRHKQLVSGRSRRSFHSLDEKSKRFQFKSQLVRTAKDLQEYTFRVRKFEELYELLSELMMGVYEANHTLIKECLRRYMSYMEEKRYEFLDHFIAQLSPKGQRTINISRIQQYMCILHIAQRILLSNLRPREDLLVNMVGFCGSNIIFIAKLYTLSRKTQSQLPFELIIRQYQRSNFKAELHDYDDIIARIQHNNETINLTEVRSRRGDFELHNKLKDFIKMAAMDKFTPSHSFSYLFEYFAYYIHLNDQLGVLECLQTSPAPYLSPESPHLTIVIEPVGVLVGQKKQQMTTRPHCLQFLNYLRQRNCEIVLWTCAMPADMKQILRLIDPQKQIKHKLYRYHCIQHEGIYVKDLRRLGRDLDKILIIDESKDSYMFDPKNGIQAPWNKLSRDKLLPDLAQIISSIINSESPVQLSLVQNKKQLDQFKAKARSKSRKLYTLK